jgi:hypothetical protein
MSAQYDRKCNRVDARMAEAKQLLDTWAADTPDGRAYVMRRAVVSTRMLAAIVHAASTPEQRLAADEICERIARERTP